jgi:hypothetical protein
MGHKLIVISLLVVIGMIFWFSLSQYLPPPVYPNIFCSRFGKFISFDNGKTQEYYCPKGCVTEISPPCPPEALCNLTLPKCMGW